MVSILTARVADAALVWPDASVTLAVRLCAPSASAEVVKLHAPLLLAVAVPIWVAPSNTFTVPFAAAVPVSVRVLSLVMLSPTTPLSFENDDIFGALGACEAGGTAGALESCRTAPVFILTLWT